MTQAPALETEPELTGTPRKGETLTVTNGTWSATPTETITFKWLRCTQVIGTFTITKPSYCTEISAATNSSYVLTAADAGSYISAQVIASNTAGVSNVFTPTTTIVFASPTIKTAPTISGANVVQADLTATISDWFAYPSATLAYQWYRCTAQVTSTPTSLPIQCTAISNSTTRFYKAVTADAGHHLLIEVTATNSEGSQITWSLSLAIEGAPVAIVEPTVSGTAQINSFLTGSRGTWIGNPTPTFTYQWFSCDTNQGSASDAMPTGCSAISGATLLNYASVAADNAKYLGVAVIATNSRGTTIRYSATTAKLGGAPGILTNASFSPSKLTYVNNDVLTASPGVWTSYPVGTATYQWKRCSSAINWAGGSVNGLTGCESIAGATGETYTVRAIPDAGKHIAIQVTVTNSDGTLYSHSTTGYVEGPPWVSGTVTVGSQLTANTGSVGVGAAWVATVWYRCSQKILTSSSVLDSSCTYIDLGVAQANYTLTSADAGKYLITAAYYPVRVRINGSWTDSTEYVYSASTDIVSGPLTFLTNPTISGNNTLGSTLTATVGTWAGYPEKTSSSFTWYRCNSTTGGGQSELPFSCQVIADATSSTYVIVDADRFKYLRAAETADNGFGVVTRWSVGFLISGSG